VIWKPSSEKNSVALGIELVGMIAVTRGEWRNGVLYEVILSNCSSSIVVVVVAVVSVVIQCIVVSLRTLKGITVKK